MVIAAWAQIDSYQSLAATVTLADTLAIQYMHDGQSATARSKLARACKMFRSLGKVGRQVQQACTRSLAERWALAEPCCSQTPSRSYSKLPSDYEEYYRAAAKPVKRPAPLASTSSPAETEVPLQPAVAGAAPAVDAVDVGLAEQQRRGAAAGTHVTELLQLMKPFDTHPYWNTSTANIIPHITVLQ